MNRVIVMGGLLLVLAPFAFPQSAEAQNGGRWDEDRYGRQIDDRFDRGRGNQRGRQYDRYSNGGISFDWDLNGFSVRDQSSIEAQIRRDLNADAGSWLSGRRGANRGNGRYRESNETGGTIDVNVAFTRLNRDTVQAEVRLGLNRDGRGASAVTATESATVHSTDDNLDGRVVQQAFRRVRREFATKVDRYQRNDDNGRNRNRADRY
jgi:hypothetical protein